MIIKTRSNLSGIVVGIEEGEESVDSDTIQFYNDVYQVMISLVFSSEEGENSTAKVQVTTNTPDEIEADEAVWFDWSSGDKTSNFQTVIYAPTALKVVNLGAGDISYSLKCLM